MRAPSYTQMAGAGLTEQELLELVPDSWVGDLEQALILFQGAVLTLG